MAPPSALPTRIDPRRTGATSISRRNPNSRSHTIDAAENIAVNSTDVASTPGNMNVCRSTPPVELVGQRRQAGAEHEEEQHRLDERGDDAEAVLTEADQLALPHHLDAAQVLAQAAVDDVRDGQRS